MSFNNAKVAISVNLIQAVFIMKGEPIEKVLTLSSSGDVCELTKWQDFMCENDIVFSTTIKNGFMQDEEEFDSNFVYNLNDIEELRTEGTLLLHTRYKNFLKLSVDLFPLLNSYVDSAEELINPTKPDWALAFYSKYTREVIQILIKCKVIPIEYFENQRNPKLAYEMLDEVLRTLSVKKLCASKNITLEF